MKCIKTLTEKDIATDGKWILFDKTEGEYYCTVGRDIFRNSNKKGLIKEVEDYLTREDDGGALCAQ